MLNTWQYQLMHMDTERSSARRLATEGIDWLGVALVEEARTSHG
jgi:hypothetical protein